jgi:hypothetical protein
LINSRFIISLTICLPLNVGQVKAWRRPFVEPGVLTWLQFSLLNKRPLSLQMGM